MALTTLDRTHNHVNIFNPNGTLVFFSHNAPIKYPTPLQTSSNTTKISTHSLSSLHTPFSLSLLRMSPVMGKCNKIRHIVRIRQMLRRWRKNASSSSHGRIIPSDVPAGHVAISVGSGCRRFVVRATYLNHPIFKKLLARAEEEYGFTNEGPLALPCDESVFEEILRLVSRSESSNPARFEDFQRCCHVDYRNSRDILGESRPLLHGLADKSVC